MLKPPEQGAVGPEPAEERPVGDLVHQLVEDGKAYARAELGVATAIASSKANALKVPVILFAGAFLVLQAAVTVLAMTVYLTLVPAIGLFLAGLAAFLLFLALAGGLAWFGVKRLREDL